MAGASLTSVALAGGGRRAAAAAARLVLLPLQCCRQRAELGPALPVPLLLVGGRHSFGFAPAGVERRSGALTRRAAWLRGCRAQANAADRSGCCASAAAWRVGRAQQATRVRALGACWPLLCTAISSDMDFVDRLSGLTGGPRPVAGTSPAKLLDLSHLSPVVREHLQQVRRGGPASLLLGPGGGGGGGGRRRRQSNRGAGGRKSRGRIVSMQCTGC